MEKDIKKMNETLKGLYQEKKISFSEWERTLKWYAQDGNTVEFCRTCNKPKVSDGLDICFECCNKLREAKIMNEKNKKSEIKDAVDNNKNKKVKAQIDNGFKIAEKWKQQRDEQEKLQKVIDKVLFDEPQETTHE